MKVTLDLSKSIEENASGYFEKAKKLKKKSEKIKLILEKYEKELKEEQKRAKEREAREKKPKREKKWYEKFRWFISSEGFLVIAGRDATTNEIIIKKHLEPKDIVFHTDIAGSPFAVVKSEGKEIGEQTLNETAVFTAVFSKGWKSGMSSMKVFYVLPEQVSKEAQPGEYISKGSFMIRGKKNYIDAVLDIYIGVNKEQLLMAGPKPAVEKQCEKYVRIVQGRKKKSDVAKKILKLLGYEELDDAVSILPESPDIDLRKSKIQKK
jgi:predicted ribosome quality control (RQC) complex YloA/Tae2 family protein